MSEDIEESNTPGTCPTCGEPISSGAPAGLCPKCALAGVAEELETEEATLRPRLNLNRRRLRNWRSPFHSSRFWS